MILPYYLHERTIQLEILQDQQLVLEALLKKAGVARKTKHPMGPKPITFGRNTVYIPDKRRIARLGLRRVSEFIVVLPGIQQSGRRASRLIVKFKSDYSHPSRELSRVLNKIVGSPVRLSTPQVSAFEVYLVLDEVDAFVWQKKFKRLDQNVDDRSNINSLTSFREKRAIPIHGMRKDVRFDRNLITLYRPKNKLNWNEPGGPRNKTACLHLFKLECRVELQPYLIERTKDRLFVGNLLLSAGRHLKEKYLQGFEAVNKPRWWHGSQLAGPPGSYDRGENIWALRTSDRIGRYERKELKHRAQRYACQFFDPVYEYKVRPKAKALGLEVTFEEWDKFIEQYFPTAGFRTATFLNATLLDGDGQRQYLFPTPMNSSPIEIPDSFREVEVEEMLARESVSSLALHDIEGDQETIPVLKLIKGEQRIYPKAIAEAQMK